MSPIDAEIVLFFQAGWIILVCLLVRHLLKLKAIINELRGVIVPFALVWEKGKIVNTDDIAHSFKRAFDIYTRSR